MILPPCGVKDQPRQSRTGGLRLHFSDQVRTSVSGHSPSLSPSLTGWASQQVMGHWRRLRVIYSPHPLSHPHPAIHFHRRFALRLPFGRQLPKVGPSPHGEVAMGCWQRRAASLHLWGGGGGGGGSTCMTQLNKEKKWGWKLWNCNDTSAATSRCSLSAAVDLCTKKIRAPPFSHSLPRSLCLLLSILPPPSFSHQLPNPLFTSPSALSLPLFHAPYPLFPPPLFSLSLLHSFIHQSVSYFVVYFSPPPPPPITTASSPLSHVNIMPWLQVSNGKERCTPDMHTHAHLHISTPTSPSSVFFFGVGRAAALLWTARLHHDPAPPHPAPRGFIDKHFSSCISVTEEEWSVGTGRASQRSPDQQQRVPASFVPASELLIRHRSNPGRLHTIRALSGRQKNHEGAGSSWQRAPLWRGARRVSLTRTYWHISGFLSRLPWRARAHQWSILDAFSHHGWVRDCSCRCVMRTEPWVV